MAEKVDKVLETDKAKAIKADDTPVPDRNSAIVEFATATKASLASVQAVQTSMPIQMQVPKPQYEWKKLQLAGKTDNLKEKVYFEYPSKQTFSTIENKADLMLSKIKAFASNYNDS